MRMIDSHAHLYLSDFEDDRQAVIDRAKAAGIEKVYLPNIDLSTTRSMLQLCLEHPTFFYPMLGLHPTSVKEDYKTVLNKLFMNFDPNTYSAIGEIGIDLYWDKTFINEQIAAFEYQIELAKERSLPIVIHVRESFTEVFEVIDRQMDDRLSGIFHCFTGNLNQAKKIMEYGSFKMGIGGVVTFKNSGLDQFLGKIPLEYLVLETDSPYLAPTPYRGKRNESAYLKEVVDKLSEIYQLPAAKIGEITSVNCSTIFDK